MNCEDGSLSSHSTGEHYTIDDIRNRSRSDVTSTNENGESMLTEDHQQQIHSNEPITGILDFSFKMDSTNEHLNRSRSLNTSNKPRSLKRKHPNDNIDNGGTISMATRVFHADAFCGICRKVKIFLKSLLKLFPFLFFFRNFVINIF